MLSGIKELKVGNLLPAVLGGHRVVNSKIQLSYRNKLSNVKSRMSKVNENREP